MQYTSTVILLGYKNVVDRRFYTRYGVFPMKIKVSKATASIVTPLGRQVKDLRRGAGLTQAQMARRTGVGLRFVRDLEQGKPSVRVDKVNQVLALFGYHVEAVKDHETSA
jgi:y4mF family transcriptional regulator